ncbi:MAG: sulfatase-like hydrolase/transferase [Armatimonadetes bacterium]|nr:sulfatase-like hydrolase/transferase [Armatimonadota bacterium]
MNILVLDVDTLRADHLSAYGYRYPTTPAMDRLAAEGALFENALCAGLPTAPAHTSFYTGRHPIAHGIVSHGGARDLPDMMPFLPELLAAQGFTTAAVDNLYDNKKGFARGYEYYINPGLKRKAGLLITAEELNARAISWLRQHADEPFFLFLHYWDPHTPYLPPERYRDLFYEGVPDDPDNDSLDVMQRQPLGDLWTETWFPKLHPDLTDADYVRAAYDQCIRYTDDAIGEILNTLEELGIAGETLVALMGDHGESMTEHDIYFEHHGLYEPTLRVPLILRWPDTIPAGRRIPALVQHTDLLPTFLEATGTKIPEGVDGHSLWPLIRGEVTSVRPFAIAEECTWQAAWCIRTERHKLILYRQPGLHNTPMRELYDLAADPGETRNLALEEWELADHLEREFERWLREKMHRHSLIEDPLIEQGITLGKRWLAERDRFKG